MKRVLLLAAVCSILLAPASLSRATSVTWTELCGDPLTAVASFEVPESVCLTGEIDFTCMSGPLLLPGVDIYVVATGNPDPFDSVTPKTELRGITAAAGAFFSEEVWPGPLTPGSYDVVLDEHCDGSFNSDDLRAVGVFTVQAPVLSVPGLPPAGIALMGALVAGLVLRRRRRG